MLKSPRALLFISLTFLITLGLAISLQGVFGINIGGNINFVPSGIFGVSGIRVPTGPSDIATKGYADSIVANAGNAIYGDSFDGDVIISANTTLSRDMYYNNLTINSGVTLNPGGFRIFVRNTLTLMGTIARVGNNGGNASSGLPGIGGSFLAPGSIGQSNGGSNGAAHYDTETGELAQAGGGGGGGGGVVVIIARIITGTGSIDVRGGNGGNAYINYTTTGAPSIAGAGGVATAPTANEGGFRTLQQAILLYTHSGARVHGGAGGSGGAAAVAAPSSNGFSMSTSLGGNGGIGGSSGAAAGGGGGGGGGVIVLIYDSSSAITKTANGGAGGAGIPVSPSFYDGAPGSPGSAGTIIEIKN